MFPSFTARYRTTDVFALVSLLLISILLLSYILFPIKSQANMQKISLTVSLWILTSMKFFTMFQDYSHTFCQNEFITATYRNPRCGIMAFLLTFGVHAVVLWSSMRAYTLLAMITYQKSLTSTRWIVAINVICWGVPLVFATAALGTETVGYAFSGTCAARAGLQKYFYFIPILVRYAQNLDWQ